MKSIFFDFQEILNFAIKLILEPNLPYHTYYVEIISFKHLLIIHNLVRLYFKKAHKIQFNFFVKNIYDLLY